MKINKIQVGMLGTNCYIIGGEGEDGVIIDPGADAQTIKRVVKSTGVIPKEILLTHGHFDHIGAARELMEEYGIRVRIHKADIGMLLDPEGFWGFKMNFKAPECAEEDFLKDGDLIEVGKYKIAVYHTPGHSRGSVVYMIEDSLITGDTLFEGSIGRTDFEGGDMSQMMESLKRLSRLEGDYKIYAGHGEDTSLEYEKENNMYMRML